MTSRASLWLVLAVLPALCSVEAVLPPVAAAQPLIVIDAGHGGSDPGAVGCSALEEAGVVLDVSQRLRVLLESPGVRVALTRDTDTFVGLSARAAFANSRAATGFVSIHSNAFNTTVTGTEAFVMTGAGARSRELGTGVQNAMLAAWGLFNRGLKEGNYAVLRETNMPATLGELAFTDHCDPDAALLRDPAARQRMAEHLRNAVLAWLGVDPSTPTMGTLRGVVFEDQGVGTEDLTVRLPGAMVRITPGDASASADAGEAAWSFSLMPGEYTVEASNAGHVTATRVCTVTSGMTTWCSIGLLPDAVAEVDAGTGDDAGTSVEDDAGTMTNTDASTVGRDAGAGREPVEGCGCTVIGGAQRNGWASIGLLAAAVLVLLRRRRAVVIAASVAAIVIVGCAHETTSSAGAELRSGATSPAAPSAVVTAASPVAAFATLGAPREWLAEGYVAPIIAPAGTHVLLSTEDHAALFVAELDGGTFREVCRVGRCGWEPRWQDGGAAIAYRTEGQTGTAVPAEAATLGGERVPVTVGERGVHAWTDDEDRAWLREGGRTREIGPEGERVMMPAITGDGRHVVMWGLSEGVLVHRVADGALVCIGEGGHARVDPSGRWMVLERTEDDGHAVTESDLYVVDLADPAYAIAPLLVGAESAPRMPSLSRVDERGEGVLAYVEGGALIVRSIRFAR